MQASPRPVAVEKVGGNFLRFLEPSQLRRFRDLIWSHRRGRWNLMVRSSAASGDQTIQPKETPVTILPPSGRAGVYTSDATVNVNNAVTASLNVSPDDVVTTGGRKLEQELLP